MLVQTSLWMEFMDTLIGKADWGSGHDVNDVHDGGSDHDDQQSWEDEQHHGEEQLDGHLLGSFLGPFALDLTHRGSEGAQGVDDAGPEAFGLDQQGHERGDVLRAPCAPRGDAWLRCAESRG